MTKTALRNPRRVTLPPSFTPERLFIHRGIRAAEVGGGVAGGIFGRGFDGDLVFSVEPAT